MELMVCQKCVIFSKKFELSFYIGIRIIISRLLPDGIVSPKW